MKSHLFSDPFKFCILENFLPLQYADRIYKELRQVEINDDWYKYDSPFEKKRSTDSWTLFPPNVSHFLMSTLTGPFIKNIEEQMGMTGLVADGNLRGGGIHIQERDSFLGIHADMQIHPSLKLYRRVNAILFMNKEWAPEWNGNLEFWDSTMTECKKKIEPRFNRMVLFETHANSFHGMPDKVMCPETHRRMSLATYFWSATVPENMPINNGSTDFRLRPGEETNEEIEKLRHQRRIARLSSNV